MPDPKFHIIFDSRQVAANEREALKKRLKTGLRLDDADLARLFDGRPVVIQRNLGECRANALLERFKALGAPCRMEAQPIPKHSPQLSDSLVVCPKCQHSQPPAEECNRCGLIFSNYVQGKRVKPAPEPVETEKGVDSDPTSE